MDECEWKSGDYIPCETAKRFFKRSNIFQGKLEIYWGNVSYIFSFCPFCGVNIEKPKPKIMIARSNKTWVAKCDEDNYICNNSDYYKDNNDLTYIAEDFLVNPHFWTKFSTNQRITEGFARLFPKVVIKGRATCIENLWGIKEKECITEKDYRLCWTDLAYVRLATVDDLCDCSKI